MTDPDGNTATYSYDPTDQLIAVYSCVALDAQSRRVVGWSIDAVPIAVQKPQTRGPTQRLGRSHLLPSRRPALAPPPHDGPPVREALE